MPWYRQITLIQKPYTIGLGWQKTLGGAGTVYARGIFADPDGGLTVTGSSTSTDGDVTGNHGFYDIWALKLIVQ